MPSFIATTDYEIKKVKIDKANKVDNFLVFTYFVAAVAVGAFIILLMQNGFRSMLSSIITKFGGDFMTAASLAKGIYTFCALIAIFVGPIFAWRFFEKIIMVELRERLIFLVMGSGILAFIACVIAVGVIAGIIALIWVLIKLIWEILKWILIGALVIGIIGGMISGG